jgi:hypothetical protein
LDGASLCVHLDGLLPIGESVEIESEHRATVDDRADRRPCVADLRLFAA